MIGRFGTVGLDKVWGQGEPLSQRLFPWLVGRMLEILERRQLKQWLRCIKTLCLVSSILQVTCLEPMVKFILIIKLVLLLAMRHREACSAKLFDIEYAEFKKEGYLGYNNKRDDVYRPDESFPLGKCSTFKFIYILK